MLCWKDRSYCSASRTLCQNTKCYRYMSEEEQQKAIDFGLPVAYMDFFDGCKEKVTCEN